MLKSARFAGVSLVTLILSSGAIPLTAHSQTLHAVEQNALRAPASDEFPDAQAILTTQDIPGMLAQLKAIAQPTDDYHQKLLKVALDAKSIDMAHLGLLVDACSYQLSDQASLMAEIQELQSNGDSARRK